MNIKTTLTKRYEAYQGQYDPKYQVQYDRLIEFVGKRTLSANDFNAAQTDGFKPSTIKKRLADLVEAGIFTKIGQPARYSLADVSNKPVKKAQKSVQKAVSQSLEAKPKPVEAGGQNIVQIVAAMEAELNDLRAENAELRAEKLAETARLTAVKLAFGDIAEKVMAA